MFGGSFRNGTRNSNRYLHYFDDLSANGYTVISIDYRLGLKDVQPKNMQEIIAAMKYAIDIAVEDLYDATLFILKNAPKWKVDVQKIVISGSSAGAVSVLQAEYERCNQTPLAARLPDGFRYAGVIGFAGAILSSGDLRCNTQPAPVLLLHGDCDRTVPFGKLTFEGVNMNGSQEIARQLHDAGMPYCLYQFVGAKHEIADRPMEDNLPEIRRFLHLWVLNGQSLMADTLIQNTDKKEPCHTITMEDFILSNFK
jgi:acetyl esterase/lipase